MTLFTQITLNPANPDARRVLASREATHAVIAAACDGSARPLWRRHSNDRLYVVSDVIDEARLRARLGSPDVVIRDYTKLDRLEGGASHRFTTTVCPTKRNPDGRRIPLTTPDDVSSWLVRQLADAADVARVTVDAVRPLRFRKRGAAVTLNAVDVIGVLTVKDVESMRRVLTGGLGRGKAYGLGLMMLAG